MITYELRDYTISALWLSNQNVLQCNLDFVFKIKWHRLELFATWVLYLTGWTFIWMTSIRNSSRFDTCNNCSRNYDNIRVNDCLDVIFENLVKKIISITVFSKQKFDLIKVIPVYSQVTQKCGLDIRAVRYFMVQKMTQLSVWESSVCLSVLVLQ